MGQQTDALAEAALQLGHIFRFTEWLILFSVLKLFGGCAASCGTAFITR